MLAARDVVVRDMYALGLGHSGFDVTHVGRVEDALAEVQRRITAAVILISEMNGVGLAVLAAMRADPRSILMPIVVLCGRSILQVGPGEVQATLDAGADCWLDMLTTSPVTIGDELRALMLARRLAMTASQ